MLTGSSNSYLGQDYLQPLPTTLDAKNSPLALLAATCNNIGKDDSAKAIIPPIERKDRRDSNKPLSPERNIMHDKDKGSSSPNDYGRRSDRSGSPRSHIDVTSPMKREHSLDRNRSPLRRRSVSPRSPHRLSHSSSSDIKSNNNIASKISLNCGSLSVEINHKESHGSSSSSNHSHHRSPPARPSSSSSSLLPPSSSKSGSIHPHHTGLLSTYYPHLGLPGYSMLQGANPLLAAQHKLAASEGAGHTPVTYATVKTASGSSTLVPVCADPFCMQCKIAMQTAQLNPAAPCPAGCTQCTRDRLPGHHGLPSGSGGLHSFPGLHHGLGGGSSSSAAALAAALYGGHSPVVGSNPFSSASTTPALVCNWVGGGKYCGERFSTSEELMTHLRSHTSSLEQSSLHAASLAAAAAAAASSPYAGLSHAQLSSLSHLYPSSISPNSSLRNAVAASYSGRSLSPNSILSASSRFHPYLKSPLAGLGSTFPPTSIPGVQPGLGQYPSSLYAFPGTRLGPLVP